MSALYPTPHNSAHAEDIAKTVLMPGDPLRAELIAKSFLTDAALVNNVRGIHGYTGTYDGARVTVMASGMGIPSIGIYSYELFNFYGVENIIRIGSAGAISPDIQLRDIVIGMGACTDSAYASQFHLPGSFAPICSYKLLKICADIAEDMKLNYHIGNLLSSDSFYRDETDLADAEKSTPRWSKMGVMAIEMEAAGLYMNAARSGKKALAICTVSDHILTGEKTTAEERQNSFTEMMQLALKTAVVLDRE